MIHYGTTADINQPDAAILLTANLFIRMPCSLDKQLHIEIYSDLLILFDAVVNSASTAAMFSEQVFFPVADYLMLPSVL